MSTTNIVESANSSLHSNKNFIYQSKNAYFDMTNFVARYANELTNDRGMLVSDIVEKLDEMNITMSGRMVGQVFPIFCDKTVTEINYRRVTFYKLKPEIEVPEYVLERLPKDESDAVEIVCNSDFSPNDIMEKYENRSYLNHEQVINDMLKIWHVVDKDPKYAIKKTYDVDNKVWTIKSYNYRDFISEIRGINVIERTTKNNNIQTLTAYDIYLEHPSAFIIKEFMEPSSSTRTVVKTGHQGCYLIQLYCDKNTNKYKIGKSKNLLTRLKSAEYRNAFIYLTQFVTDENKCEKKIIEEFTKKFTCIKEDSQGGFGNETFSGDINDMMDEFYRICSHYRT